MMRALNSLSFFLASFFLVFGSVVAQEESNTIFSSDEHHEIRIITHGLASLKERLALIESAKSTIELEYFIFNKDESGKFILDSLIKKSKEGIKVRIILDGMIAGSQINEHLVGELNKFGIEVKYFNQLDIIKGLKNKYRNHRKSLIIDGQVALVGGRNIGNEYFDLGKKYNFFDRDIVISGVIVQSIQKSFNDIWQSRWSKTINAPAEPSRSSENSMEYDRYIQNLEEAVRFISSDVDSNAQQLLETIGEKERLLSTQTSCDRVKFITEKALANKSITNNRVINNYLQAKIKNAQKSVAIESPYFTLNDETEATLDDALKRNINVSILTNGANSTDVKLAAAAIDKVLRKWLKRGIDFFIYNGSKLEEYEMASMIPKNVTLALHAKTFVIDDQDVIIGTHNFDFISAKYNDELMVECSGAPESFIQTVRLDMEKRKKQSTYIAAESDIDAMGDSVIYNALKAISSVFYDRLVN